MARDLGRVLFPRLCDELGVLHGVLSSASDDLEPLTSAQSVTHGWGLALAVLAVAQGIDVLGERRARDGLRLFVELVVQARGARPCPEACEQLPDLDPLASGGWEAPLLVGWTLLQARTADWRLAEEDGELRCEVELAGTAPDDPRLERIAGAFVGRVTWRRERERLALGLPLEWFVRQAGGTR